MNDDVVAEDVVAEDVVAEDGTGVSAEPKRSARTNPYLKRPTVMQQRTAACAATLAE
jgi:hypothetical protein